MRFRVESRCAVFNIIHGNCCLRYWARQDDIVGSSGAVVSTLTADENGIAINLGIFIVGVFTIILKGEIRIISEGHVSYLYYKVCARRSLRRSIIYCRRGDKCTGDINNSLCHIKVCDDGAGIVLAFFEGDGDNIGIDSCI